MQLCHRALGTSSATQPWNHIWPSSQGQQAQHHNDLCWINMITVAAAGAPSWSGGSRQCNGGTGCQNGGRCIQQQDSNNVYICQCSGIPYSGRACEIPDNQVAQPPASLATPTPTQTSTENSVGSSTAAATSLSGAQPDTNQVHV